MSRSVRSFGGWGQVGRAFMSRGEGLGFGGVGKAEPGREL